MEVEDEVRARRLTAVLEEAVGDGVPADLPARVAARLAAVPPRRTRPSLLAGACMAAGVLVVVAVAQLSREGAADAQPEPGVGVTASRGMATQDPVAGAVVVVAIRCVAEGTAVPRDNGPGAPGAQRWEGRQLQWRVNERTCDTLAALAGELRGRVLNPALRRASADSATGTPLPLVLEPAAGVRWGEVVAATDAAMMAGFLEIRWRGVETSWIVPKSVDQPVAGGALVVPKAHFFEPDEGPHELRPTVDIAQDGSISHVGVMLFTPQAGRPVDLEPARAKLLELRAALAAKGELRKRATDPKERLQVPILVRADRGTGWATVQQFLALALTDEIGFWKLEIGVTGKDLDVEPAGTAGK